MEPTTFAALKAMERLGYIRRGKRGNDRKKTFIFLTPGGRALRQKLVPLAEEVNRIAVRGVRRAQVAATRTVLLAVIENLARDELAANMRMPSTRALSGVEKRRRLPARRARTT